MLDRLFGSATRLKLLKHFLFNPEGRFTVPILAVKLQLQADVLKKELDNLQKFGLLESLLDYQHKQVDPASVETSDEEVEDEDTEAEAAEVEFKPGREVKYFALNRQFILNDEIKTLIIRAQVLYERDFIDKLLTVGNIKYLLLTGIFLNRTDTPVDLLMVGRVNKVKLGKIIKDFEKELGREINFSHFETNEFIYRRNITDVFLYNILDGDKMVIIDTLDTL